MYRVLSIEILVSRKEYLDISIEHQDLFVEIIEWNCKKENKNKKIERNSF